MLCLPCCVNDLKLHNSTISGTSRNSTPSRPECNKRHISLENGNGNVYKSIVVTNQDTAPSVIQRAMAKHNVDGDWKDYQLVQIASKNRELVIPDDGDIYHAVGPSANLHFLLREKIRCEVQHLDKRNKLVQAARGGRDRRRCFHTLWRWCTQAGERLAASPAAQ